MEIGPGVEIVTSTDEHPGLIGPLIAARLRGATIRAVPFAQLADEVRPSTDARRLLAHQLAHRRGRAGRSSPTSTCR